MREMSVNSIIRMWDTYLAEGADAFSDFHPYVCAVFLHKWRATLLEMDFQVCPDTHAGYHYVSTEPSDAAVVG